VKRFDRQRFDRLLLSINEEVAHLPSPVLHKLAPVFAAAQKELERDLSRWLRKEDGAQRFTTHKLRAALLEVRSALKGVDAAGVQLSNGLGTGARSAAELSSKHLAREVAELSSRFEGAIAPLPIREAAKLVTGTLLDRYAKQGSRWSQGVRDDIRKQLAIGVVRGETVDQMTARVAGRFGEGAIGMSERTFSKAEFDARRIVRTEVVSAYNDVKQEQIADLAKDDPKIVMLWNAALDSRTCPECRALDGKTARPGELFPGGEEAPPQHIM
jgi:SPP1 gp7 family putative phage head morphogenesis protein